MKKCMAFGITMVLMMAIFTLWGCGSGSGTDASSGSGSDAAQGDTVYNTAEIVLEENPSTGYSWTVEQMLVETQDDGSESDSDVLTITDEYKDAGSSNVQEDAEETDDRTASGGGDDQTISGEGDDPVFGGSAAENDFGLVGAAGTHTYYLTVSSDGTTDDSSGDVSSDSQEASAGKVTVKFTYARSWEDTALYTVEYDFTVSAAGALKFLEKRANAVDESAAETMPEFPDPIMSYSEGGNDK